MGSPFSTEGNNFITMYAQGRDSKVLWNHCINGMGRNKFIYQPSQPKESISQVRSPPGDFTGGLLVGNLPANTGRVPSLVREDRTCCGVTRPMHHNYWTRTQQKEKPPQWEADMLESSPCSLQQERACTQQWKPRTANNKYTIKKNFF